MRTRIIISIAKRFTKRFARGIAIQIKIYFLDKREHYSRKRIIFGNVFPFYR